MSARLLLLAAPLLAACAGAPFGGGEEDEWSDGADRAPEPATLHSMAKIYAAQGRDMDAESALRRLLDTSPDFVPAWEALARLYVRRNRLDGAVVALELGLQRQPTDVVLLNDLGVCHLLRKDPVSAAEAFTRAAAAAPDDARPRANLALALALQGRRDEALALWQQVVPPPVARANLELASAGLLPPKT